MVINFCFDELGHNPDLGYPNLAAPELRPDQFDQTWPYSIPLRLMMYLRRANIDFRTWTVHLAPHGAWYPVALGWHDHHIDYFALMPEVTRQALRQQRIRVLFYYHEGDNPVLIKRLMDQRTRANNLPPDCYVFVSANSRADSIQAFRFFSDHEHFFQYVNRRQPAIPPESCHRAFRFTVLSRTHKWWRASIMSDMLAHGLLQNSQWSYNTTCDINDDITANPLRIYEDLDWSARLRDFMQAGPYVCDNDDSEQHNDHRWINTDLYQQSYCHVVLETHFDADGSDGTFITEKTYKCLKYAQPFVVAGPAGTLASLRDQGYRVFDHVIDNSYDLVKDNTERWLSLRRTLTQLAHNDLHQWFQLCQDDLQHNQDLFMQTRKKDLVRLAEYLDSVQ